LLSDRLVRQDILALQVRSVELYRKVDYDASLVAGAIVMAIFMGTMTGPLTW